MKRTPCKECPFRRESAAGYLGAASHDPHAFLDPHWDGPTPLPCHMQVDWEAENAQEQAREAPLCQGLLIMAKNSCKMPTDREVADAVVETDADTETVFHWVHEFYQHHGDE